MEFFDLVTGDFDARRPPLLDVTGDLDLPPGLRVTGDFDRRFTFAGEPVAAAAAAPVSRRPRDCDATPLGILEPLLPPPAEVLLLLPLSDDLVDLGVLSGTLRLALPLPKGGDALPPPLLAVLLGESEPREDGSTLEARIPTGDARLPEAMFWRVAEVR